MDTCTSPPWALRRPDRAIPALPVPPLADLGELPLLAGQRRLAALFVARVAVGFALFWWCLARGWWLGLAPATWAVYGGTTTAVLRRLDQALAPLLERLPLVEVRLP